MSALCLFHGALGAPEDWNGVSWPGGWETRCFDCAGVTPESIPPDQILLGYSLGARVVAQLAVPARARALVLESYHPGCPSESERSVRAHRDEEVIRHVRGDLPGLLDTWYEEEVFQSLDSDQKVLLREQKQDRDPEHLARTLERWSLSRCPTGDRLPDLPVLLIAGELDPKYTALARQIHARSARTRLAIIPGAGHIPHLEQPERFVRAVTFFLNKLNS